MKHLKNISLCVILLILQANYILAQTNNGEWRYLASDKPIQYHFIKVKEEGEKVYFQMQIKYDKTTSVYCEKCPGYSIYISRMKNDPNDSYQLYYKFYQSENAITLDKLFSVKKLNNDGNWTSYWDDDLSMPMVKNNAGGKPEFLTFSTWCVDSFKDDGIEEFNRCKRDYKDLDPIILGK